MLIFGDRTVLYLIRSILLTIVDDYTHAIWVYLLQRKFDAYQHFVNFYAMVFNHFDGVIKQVHSDNAQKFIAGPLKSFLLECRIVS